MPFHTEGMPLSVALYGFDSDADRLDWTANGLLRSMSFSPAADGTKAALNWTPAYFSTQEAPIAGC